MKTIDFFYLNNCKVKFIFVSLMLCCIGTAWADPPSAEAFNHSSGLVLTLSDKWLEPDPSSKPELRKSSNRNLIAEKPTPKPANIGCGMDANPIATTSTSLTSQLVGKCNFNYHY